VNLDCPDVTFYVDLIGSDAYVYSEKLTGPGGLPLSSQWKMLALLDRGPLSILASFAMMRRGCVVELLVPISNTVPHLSSSTQLALAGMVGRLVTRPNYKAFTFEIDDQLGGTLTERADWRRVIRTMALKFAREERFRGVIFGDISGDLSSLGRYSTSSQVSIFYPLLGLEQAELAELSNLVGIKESELMRYNDSDRSVRSQSVAESELGDPSIPSVREVHF
jgi:thiamine biosynthesis protein ThiI